MLRSQRNLICPHCPHIRAYFLKTMLFFSFYIQKNFLSAGFMLSIYNRVMHFWRMFKILKCSKNCSLLSEEKYLWISQLKLSVVLPILRRMKYDLQELRRKGAKSYARQYGERTCARCQRPLGKFWNSGAVCRGCSHRICNKCRVGAAIWKCTVCHAYR